MGSVYEFHNIKTKDFPLFGAGCGFTDDTVMTVAVANALHAYREGKSLSAFRDEVAVQMRALGRAYPGRGYGGRFALWLADGAMRLFWKAYGRMPRAAAINLAGNVAAFIPAGLFLPGLWKRQRNFGIFVLTVLGAVSLIELAQLFTCLGSCDVDDLILNLAGAALGFGLFALPPVKRGLDKLGWLR